MHRTLGTALVFWLLAAAPSAASHQQGDVYLQVKKSDAGTVTGGGIACGTTCFQTYPLGERCTFVGIGNGSHGAGGRLECDTIYPSVTLTATPGSGWSFAGWSGGCSGSGSCSPFVDSGNPDAPTIVSAAFVDVDSPKVTINSPPAGAVRGTFTFGATATDNAGVTSVDLRLGNASLIVDRQAPYTVQVDTTTRSDGVVVLTAVASDAAGLTGNATRTVTIDNTKPAVILGVGPNGQVFGPMSTQTWNFTATDATSGVAAVECRIVPAAFAPCSGGSVSHSVADLPGGAHVFEARARDVTGNVSDPVARSFTIDATPPTATIDVGPLDGATLPGSAVEYGFAADEPSTFLCRVYPSGLTPPTFGECSASDKHAASGFVAGTYAFEVRATDAVGNVGPAAKRTFVVAAIETDRDNDGVLDAIDCNGDDPAIHQGALDVPGNRIDEDCSGSDAAFPRLNSTILFSYRTLKRHTIFTELFIQPAVAGSTVRVSCSGRGCFKSKSVKVRTAKRKLNLSRLVRGARLRPRARLEIRITKPGTIGVVRRLTVRVGKRPTTTILCIAPGATKPSACPD